MTGEEWTVLAGLIDEWWPGKFEKSAEDAWFVALKDFSAQDVADALKGRLLTGGTHRPSVGEVVGQLRADPSLPTFEEMFRLVYGPNGVLSARPKVMRFADEGARLRAYDEAALERARELHPMVAAFVVRYRVGRLRMLELDHPEHGDIRRRELEGAWGSHVRSMDARQAAALVGRGGDRGLQALDPLAAIGVGQQQIESGGDV